ncbi:hypothetical protein LBMAG42_48590 [Deltaproteobacteria bacterium]|nr:hypothetical protein LBMAG42_48590 [Deltaproteobacteria bacterium]
MGRLFLIGVAALVFGTVLGAWQPRGELLELRAEVAKLEKDTRACKRGAASAGIARILGGRDGAESEAVGDRPERQSEAPDAANQGVQEGNAKKDGVEAGEDGEQGGPDGLPSDPAAMADALDARAAQARAAMIEQADPDDEALAEIDAAIEKMNARLKTQVDAFADSIEGGAEPDRREMMEFAAEALDAVIEADDVFRDALPDDVRAEIDDEAVDPFSYIDGSTLASLARLEGAGE